MSENVLRDHLAGEWSAAKKSSIIAQEYIQDMYSAAMPVSLDNRLFGLERKINQIANAVETTTHYVDKVSVL